MTYATGPIDICSQISGRILAHPDRGGGYAEGEAGVGAPIRRKKQKRLPKEPEKEVRKNREKENENPTSPT